MHLSLFERVIEATESDMTANCKHPHTVDNRLPARRQSRPTRQNRNRITISRRPTVLQQQRLWAANQHKEKQRHSTTALLL